VKICPQCESREVDPRCRICSECRTVNRYLSQARTEARPERREARREYYRTYKSPPVGMIDPFRRDVEPERRRI